MSSGLLFECDEDVIRGLYHLYGSHFKGPMKYDKAIGVLSNGALAGAIVLHNWNGWNLELSYYGKRTLTAGIVRCLARFAICTFDLSRVTVVTSKRNRRLMRSLQRIGWRIEGIQRCYYGVNDTVRNTGVRFVMFREQIEKIAHLKDSKPDSIRC
jgi:RimJ/RimL family protein N-acetyltransferase